MIRAQIKVGHTYACHTLPRKGVVDLSRIDGAFRVMVESIDAMRYVESTGMYKRDGVEVKRMDEGDLGWAFTVKPRDILMPWADYTGLREARQRDEQRRAEEMAVKLSDLNTRKAAVIKLLGEDYELVKGESGVAQRDFVEYNYYSPNDQEPCVGFTIEGMEKLLAAISERVYRILSEQD